MSLALADPVAHVLAYLRADPALGDLLDDPDAAISAVDWPPYPRIVVSDPPGVALGTGRYVLPTTVQCEVLGDAQGYPGRAALKTLGYALLDALRALPEQPYPVGLVITNVDFGAFGYFPLPAGRDRYLLRATLTSHPGAAAF